MSRALKLFFNIFISSLNIAVFYYHASDLTISGYDKTFKESFSFKTRMPGTVKCRPTVAYWVQIDGINIATELITRYYSNETLIQCCFNVRPTSATLAQHWTNMRSMYNVWEKVLLPSKRKIFVWHLCNVGPTYSTLVQHCIKSYKCFVFTGWQYKLGGQAVSKSPQ